MTEFLIFTFILFTKRSMFAAMSVRQYPEIRRALLSENANMVSASSFIIVAKRTIVVSIIRPKIIHEIRGTCRILGS